MQLRSGKEAAQRMHRFISSKHQVHAYSVDLTARQIYSLGPTGAVDFAGSDYLAADPHAVSAYQKHSQDKYRWWSLLHGAYLVEFNETLELAENEIALLEPHERLLRAGAVHPALYVRGKVDPIATMLSVAGAKIEIKQNARISSLRLFRLAADPSRPAAPKKAGKKAKKKTKKKAPARKTAKKKKRR